MDGSLSVYFTGDWSIVVVPACLSAAADSQTIDLSIDSRIQVAGPGLAPLIFRRETTQNGSLILSRTARLDRPFRYAAAQTVSYEFLKNHQFE